VKLRAIAVAVGLAAAHTAANAWFFFFIPGGAISAVADKIAGVEGEHCIPSTAKPGDVIGLPDGTKWKVISVSGTSDRCRNVYQPIRAKLEPIYSGEQGPEQEVCVGRGSQAGDRVRLPASPEMVIVRLGGSATCSIDYQRPVSAVARATNTVAKYTPIPPGHACVPGTLKAGDIHYDNGNPMRIATVAEHAPACAGTNMPNLAALFPATVQQPQAEAPPAASTAQKSVVDRLRDLKQLRDENLITQELYETKQRDIMNGQ